MVKSHLRGPLVSIIIPAYNAGEYIFETLQSVLNQNYQNVEIIVVNDGSTDDTSSIIKPLIDNPKLQVINQNNKGAAAARNAGYARARGRYIKFLDGDDLINPDMITQQVALIIENPGCLISAQWGRFYGNDLDTFKPSREECWQTMASIDWIFSSWKKTQSTTVPGIFLIPREIIDVAGIWNENLSLLDDTEYFTRTILAAEKVVFSEQSILYYRSGLKNNLSNTQSYKGFQSAYQALKNTTNAILKKRNDYDAKLLCSNIWQLFIFNLYPEHPDLIAQAKLNLRELPPPTLAFPCGGFTKFLKNIVGWKAVKLIKKTILRRSPWMSPK